VDDSDESAAHAYGLTAFPLTVFVDSSGTVVGRASGGIPAVDLIALAGQIG
jgi:hypothetical protein